MKLGRFQKVEEVSNKMICDFCGGDIKKGTGKQFIKDSGKIINFCTKKCERHMLVYKKRPRYLKRTEMSHKEKATKE